MYTEKYEYVSNIAEKKLIIHQSKVPEISDAAIHLREMTDVTIPWRLGVPHEWDRKPGRVGFFDPKDILLKSNIFNIK